MHPLRREFVVTAGVFFEAIIGKRIDYEDM